jgi:hypothetical protein
VIRKKETDVGLIIILYDEIMFLSLFNFIMPDSLFFLSDVSGESRQYKLQVLFIV